MANKRCRLYDETLVHNIMLSTGLSILEYLRENANADSDEIFDFIEVNADIIINDTIKHLKGMSDLPEKDEEAKPGEDSDSWPLKEEEE